MGALCSLSVRQSLRPNSDAITPLLIPLPIDEFPGLHYPCGRLALCAEAAKRASGGIGSQPDITDFRC